MRRHRASIRINRHGDDGECRKFQTARRRLLAGRGRVPRRGGDTAADAIVVWGSFALFNLLLTILVLRIRPRTAANVVLGVLFGFNGAVAVLEAATAAGFEVGGDPLRRLLDYPTGAALLALPFVYPRRRLPRWGEAAGVIVLAAIGAAGTYSLQAKGPAWTAWGNHAAILAFGGVPILGVSIGVVLFLDRYLGARSRLQVDLVVFLLAAYLLKAATLVPIVWTYRPLDPATWQGSGWLVAFATGIPVTLAVAAVFIGLVAGAAHRIRGGTSTRASTDALFVVLGALGLALGYAQMRVQTAWSDDVFRLEHQVARPLLLAAGVLRFQVLAVDLRRESRLVGAVAFAAILVLFVTLQQSLVGFGLEGGLAAGVSMLASGAGGLLVVGPILPGRPRRDDGRDRQVYRAAVEAAILNPNDAGRAQELRQRLSIGEAEHALAVDEVRQALLGEAGRSADAAVPGSGSRYRVDRVLGEGGGGRAYLAFDHVLSRWVVLKTSHVDGPAAAAAAAREARLLASVRHPNVVTIHDVAASGGQTLIVMEYISGGSLGDRLESGPIPIAEALHLLDGVLAGLQAVHAAGLIHGDIKAANILLDEDGTPKLGDFGIARSEGSGTAVGFSLSGAAVGSIRTMAPEQVRGTDVDARADLYAASAVLYEAIAGHPYLDLAGRSDFDTRLAILEDEPLLPIAGVPTWLNDALAAGLAKDRSRRPATAGEFRRRLANGQSSAGGA